MRRLFGLMPSAEIEISKRYKDNDDKIIVIEAGKNGWTILYADASTEYEDVEATAEENFEKAFNVAKDALGELTPIENEPCDEVYEEEYGEC